MNINEVISNRAHILEGKELGKSEKTLSPNDDVNLSQSSNDTFPTAINIAAMKIIKDNTLVNLKILRDSLSKKSNEFNKIVKIGRTHLMDATPLTLGQEFSGYHTQIEYGIKAIKNTLDHLSEIALGGTAVGTGINSPKNYDEIVANYISEFTGITFKTAKNKFEALAAHDAIVETHGALKQVAVSLNKIANDIRWLACGPMAGIGELILPTNEPGSSIMPGKVNPTQCEAVNMVYAQILGNDTTINYAGTNGNFELNTYRPIIASSIHESISLLTEVAESFTINALDGIKANEKKIKENLDKSLMLVTALAPKIGYEKAAEIAKKALKENISLKQSAKALGHLSEQEFDKIVKPELMVTPKKA